MKTKTAILIFSILCSAFELFSQTQTYIVLVDDTINLAVNNANGSIQWQQSDDSLTWNDIIAGTNNPQSVIVTSSSTGKIFYRAKITNAVICNNSSWYSSIIWHKVINSTSQILKGDWFHGGIVFYTNGFGSGLIKPQQSLNYTAQWGCMGVSTGAVSTTDGNLNTSAIIAGCSSRPIAASICDTLTINGYSDWFLPSLVQLNYYYQYDSLIGIYVNDTCWSSTESDFNTTWVQDFEFGQQSINDKEGFNYHVLGIRSFLTSESNGKIYSLATVISQPVVADFTTQPVTQIKCNGSQSTFSVSVSGTPPITYQWLKNGIAISSEDSTILTINNLSVADEAIYTCEATNLCSTTSSNNAELKVIKITANAGLDSRICNGQNTQLQAIATSNYTSESGTLTYSWSPLTNLSNANIANPFASPLLSTIYTITATDQLGCSDSSSLELTVGNVFQDEHICLVTVDTSVWKNKIMWEKTTDVGTIGYNVYKEVATNIYSGIGFISFSDPSFLIDNSSNPESYSSRYKITTVDTCGNESEKSSYHKSINLTIATFGTTIGLNWNDYIDESGLFIPLNYYIYKGTASTNMQLVDSVPGGTNSYNDNNVVTSFYYMVAVKKTNGCNTGTKANSSISFSNKKQNAVGINDNNYSYFSSIYPNPFSESTTLIIPVNHSISSNPELNILDITGKVTRTVYLSNKDFTNEILIERGNLKAGVYFVELKADKIYRGKLIIE